MRIPRLDRAGRIGRLLLDHPSLMLAPAFAAYIGIYMLLYATSNPNLDPVDHRTFAFNTAAVICVAIANLVGAKILPFKEWRPVFTASGLLALIYMIGYIQVLYGELTVYEWSRMFRGISPVAFAIPWTAPVIVTAWEWYKALLEATREDDRDHH